MGQELPLIRREDIKGCLSRATRDSHAPLTPQVRHHATEKPAPSGFLSNPSFSFAALLQPGIYSQPLVSHTLIAKRSFHKEGAKRDRVGL